jgi:hypothetical protein
MANVQLASSSESVIDTMIELVRLGTAQRVIVAGADNLDAYLSLQRRGFARTATTATCRIPCGQHDVGLIIGWHSVKALEQLVARLVNFLHAAAVLAVWVDIPERARSREVRLLLERWGFRVEAGATCGDGFVLSARRQERLANAA